MPKAHKPRCGSLQFWPRVRAKREYTRIRSWKTHTQSTLLLGFGGYKLGMTQALIEDTRKHSLTKGSAISVPATVLQCPPLKMYAVRLYGKNFLGEYVLTDVLYTHLDKMLKRKITLPKKKDLLSVEHAKKYLDRTVRVVALVFTQPHITSLSKKKPEIFEVGIGGATVVDQFTYATSLFGKEIRVGDLFKEHSFIDVHAVTKGKGFQGSVKRFGVSLKSHKSEKKRRAVGNLGAWTPKRVLYSVGLPGKMGYHVRTDYGKLLLSIDSDVSKINPRGAFPGYGFATGDYIVVKGSVPGPKKRFVRFNTSVRKRGIEHGLSVKAFSLESQQ